MPNEESSVTYAVEITNLGNTDMAISDISGLPDNLDYSISKYNLRDILSDDNDSNHCSFGSVSTIYITIGYTNNKYIDTGINLYNSSNYTKDFEIDEYSLTAQEILSGNTQNTIMNSKAENITNYPGVLLRKSSNNLEAKSFDKAATKSYDTVTSFSLEKSIVLFYILSIIRLLYIIVIFKIHDSLKLHIKNKCC